MRQNGRTLADGYPDRRREHRPRCAPELGRAAARTRVSLQLQWGFYVGIAAVSRGSPADRHGLELADGGRDRRVALAGRHLAVGATVILLALPHRLY